MMTYIGQNYIIIFFNLKFKISFTNLSFILFSGMETVWLQEFSKLFIQFLPHSWYIMPVEEPPIPEDSLYSFFDSAKVRFCCEVSVQSRDLISKQTNLIE